MPKFSGPRIRANLRSPIRTTGVPMPTYEGALGYQRDARSELFLLAVSNMVRESTFYEPETERDTRFGDLIHLVVPEDAAWVAGFVPYLRNVMQMRSASVVMAAEYVRAGGPRGRAVVDAALQRADEPAELLAYWAQTYGRAYPQPLKRGVADAVRRLYSERSALKYDGLSRAWRMGDVVELVHPRPRDARQSALFRYLLDHRRGRDGEYPELETITYARALEDLPLDERRLPEYLNPESLARAGITWERLSGWLQGPMDAAAWSAVIPTMGYMALLRNLRNFEDAGVPDAVLDGVADRIADPAEVQRSRQFPIRFYSAYKATDSVRFSLPLERALQHSLANIPQLSGRTLILVDVSGSMFHALSGRSTVQSWEIAALFGAALAQRCTEAEVYAYSHGFQRVEVGRAIVRSIPNFVNWLGARQSTETWDTLREVYRGQDRVVILTDEQAHPSSFDPRVIPVPVYTFNLAGYQVAQMPQGEHGRYSFGGLTDAGFVMLHLIEEQRDATWPWLDQGTRLVAGN